MAIAITQKTISSSGSDTSSYNTASWTPSADTLYIMMTYSHQNTTVNTPIISGNSLTWTLVKAQTCASAQYKICFHMGFGSSPSTGATNINFSSQTQKRCAWGIWEVTGTDIGNSGANGVVQSNGAAGASTSTTVSLSSFKDAVQNVVMGVCFANVSTNIADEAGYTQLTQFNCAETSNNRLQVCYKTGEDTSVVWTYSSNSYRGGIAIELGVPSIAGDQVIFVN